MMRRILVPLGVAVLLVAFWYWPRGEPGLGPQLPGDVGRCAANLREVYRWMVARESAAGELPRASGPALLEALLAAGEDREPDVLACPGPRAPAPEGASPVGGYAARDLVTFPLERFPAGGARNEPLVACDGAAETPHDGCINVLYTDGSVVVLTLEDEIAAGHLAPGTRALPVGPGSPVPGLEKLVGRE